MNERLLQWQRDNPWFGSDERKTLYALHVHCRVLPLLTAQGMERYLEAIDKGVLEYNPDKPVDKYRVLMQLKGVIDGPNYME